MANVSVEEDRNGRTVYRVYTNGEAEEDAAELLQQNDYPYSGYAYAAGICRSHAVLLKYEIERRASQSLR